MGRPRKKAQGLGDTIEQITEVTGIKTVVKALFGDDCGCDARKEKLNKLFPYNKIECLEEREFNTLTEIITAGKNSYSPNEQIQLLKVYNRVFNINQQPTNCSSCWREIINRLQKLIEQYKIEMNENN
jgi:hypothetical protein